MPLSLDNLKSARGYHDWKMFLQCMMNLKQHCACQIARILVVAARETCKNRCYTAGTKCCRNLGVQHVASPHSHTTNEDYTNSVAAALQNHNTSLSLDLDHFHYNGIAIL